jgi:diacylglycerol kinase
MVLKRFLKSFGYAIHGVVKATREQLNLKIQMVAGGITVAAGFYFDITRLEWCAILIAIGLVIGLEMINTAIEGLVDLVTVEKNPLAGKIKDIAAGAVLFVSIIAFIVGLLIFRKYVVS